MLIYFFKDNCFGFRYDAIIENGHTVTLPNGYQGITKKLDLRGGLKQGVGAGVRVSN
jgi:hypothetical protein